MLLGPSPGHPRFDQVMEQLTEERKKIVVVKGDIESALEEANQVLTSAGI